MLNNALLAAANLFVRSGAKPAKLVVDFALQIGHTVGQCESTLVAFDRRLLVALAPMKSLPIA
jgi:hypothetical protein